MSLQAADLPMELQGLSDSSWLLVELAFPPTELVLLLEFPEPVELAVPGEAERLQPRSERTGQSSQARQNLAQRRRWLICLPGQRQELVRQQTPQSTNQVWRRQRKRPGLETLPQTDVAKFSASMYSFQTISKQRSVDIYGLFGRDFSIADRSDPRSRHILNNAHDCF